VRYGGEAVGEEDFAALYRWHRSALVWYLRCHGADDAEAADAVQDAFACALRAGDLVRDPGAWPGWLRTVAFRCYVRSLAGRSGRRDVFTTADVPEPPAAAGPAVDAELRRQEERVLSLLAALPPQQRRVFALHYDGWNAAEIAALLGLQKAAVRQNIARARSALRQSVTPELASLEES
jgi:RNA polymerase sigma factor (sigma-70 family)